MSAHRHVVEVMIQLLIAVIALPVVAQLTDTDERPTLDQAKQAFAGLDLAGERRILEAVAAAPDTSAEDRVTALWRLANEDWKFHHDLAGARRRLKQGDALGTDRYSIWMIRSRVEREAGNLELAVEAAKKALSFAEGPSDIMDARTALAWAVLEQAFDSMAEIGSCDRESVAAAAADLIDILSAEPGRRKQSKLLLGAALLLDDGPTALSAWRSYYHVSADQPSGGLMDRPGRILSTLLPKLPVHRLEREERRQVVDALAQSCFYRYAALMARKPIEGDEDPLTDTVRIREIVAYSDFLNAAEELANEYYRLKTVEQDDPEAFQDRLGREAETLWQVLHFPNERPPFSPLRFTKEVDCRFGGYIRLARHDGHFGMTYGHYVADERRMIRQYGHQAEVRFVVLDFMVSNFFTTWFYGGWSSVAGWTTTDGIYQVAESYASTPFDAWRLVTDQEKRRELEQEIELYRPLDERAAAANPYAYLRSLDLRLWLASLDRLHEAVKTKGRMQRDLCLAFVSEYERVEREYSIFAHEGRHAIDRLLHPAESTIPEGEESFDAFSPEESELRAKLSEIAFSPDPRMAFSAIYDRDIGDRTPHGLADERLVRGIITWMETNAADIAGLDTARPLLLQFELLTPQQIITAVRSMDPLGRVAMSGPVSKTAN